MISFLKEDHCLRFWLCFRKMEFLKSCSFFKINLFIYLWPCWVFFAVRGLLIAVASLLAEHGL